LSLKAETSSPPNVVKVDPEIHPKDEVIVLDEAGKWLRVGRRVPISRRRLLAFKTGRCREGSAMDAAAKVKYMSSQNRIQSGETYAETHESPRRKTHDAAYGHEHGRRRRSGRSKSIRTPTKEIVIEAPEVAIVNVQGQKIFQVAGGKVSERAPERKAAAPTVSEEDVQLCAGQTGKSPEKN